MLRSAPAKLEVGLVRFGQVALDVAQATVPCYRTAFSKHQFTQPQLLAILCLMRYEDWTFREAEVRLAEHSELRRALRLRSVPDTRLCTVSCCDWTKPPSLTRCMK